MKKIIVAIMVLAVSLTFAGAVLANQENHTPNLGQGQNQNQNQNQGVLLARINELMAQINALKARLGIDNATSTHAIKQIDATCVKAAVEKREGAVATAFDAKSTCIKNALIARKNSLVNAWANKTDVKERNSAIKTAWDTFRQTKNDCQKTYKDAITNTWKQFRTDAKNCGHYGTELESEGADKEI